MQFLWISKLRNSFLLKKPAPAPAPLQAPSPAPTAAPAQAPVQVEAPAPVQIDPITKKLRDDLKVPED